MAPVHVDPDKVREFKTADAFYKWLSKHHDKEDVDGKRAGVWVFIAIVPCPNLPELPLPRGHVNTYTARRSILVFPASQ